MDGADREDTAFPLVSSASEESGALAKGELRVGRVLGLPRPNPKEDEAGGTEPESGAFGSDADEVSGGDGEPGGVVLPALTDFVGAGDVGCGEGDLGSGMFEGSGFGVVEGDLDFR